MRTDLRAICLLSSRPGQQGSSVMWHHGGENGTCRGTGALEGPEPPSFWTGSAGDE